MAGPVLSAADAKEAPLPPAQSHKFSLDCMKGLETDGGSLRLATAKEFPISQGMSGGVMTIKPGAIREMHWHPNANEWHYYLRGTAQVALFGSGGRGKVAEFKPGDVAYLPIGYGHAIRNVGKEDLEFVVTFDNGAYQELSLTQIMAASPRYLLSNNFGVPASTFSRFADKSGFIRMPT